MDIVTRPMRGSASTGNGCVSPRSPRNDGTLLFAAEDYLAGTGSAATYSFASGAGYSADYNIDPIVFEPPVQIASSALEISAATAGGPRGGAEVPSDGATYKFAARTNGPARMGVLTASFAAGDPDTADRLAVARHAAVRHAKRCRSRPHALLCCKRAAAMSLSEPCNSASTRAIPTRLYRGAASMATTSRAIGARLDDAIVRLSYDKSQIGSTIYLKLVSFNLCSGGAQLADVTAFTHVITGPPRPPNVTGFAATIGPGGRDVVNDVALNS